MATFSSTQGATVLVGSMIYTNPLDPTSVLKYQKMTERGPLFVIGQTGRCACKTFFESARFILLPRLPLPAGGFLSIQLFAPFILLWLIFRRDVNCILAQSPYEGAPAALAKKIAGVFGRKVALVVESHGNFEADLFLSKKITARNFFSFFMGVLSHFSLRNADAFRAVSHSTEQQLRDRGVTLPITIYPAWMLLEEFYAASKASPRGADILFAGDIIYRKGLDILLEAFAHIHKESPSIWLRLAGPAVDAVFLEQLRNRMRELNISDRVDLLGKLPVDRLAGEMARARVFVLPSRSEGFGRVLVEALAAGTPIVCTQAGGMPEIADDPAFSRCVPVEDAPALAKGLMKFLAPYDDERMRNVCQARARACFSAGTYVDTLFTITTNARDNAGIVPAE